MGEFGIDEVFSKIGEGTVEFNCNYRNYPVNMSLDRYKLFAANRACVCCGVIGNRMFLDYDEDNNSWHFNLYAETRDHKSGNVHMILMTRDFIIPKLRGGADDLSNFQTMCYLCNHFKFQTELSVEKIQKCLFSAYRIYKNSFVIKETRKRNEAIYGELQKDKGLIDNLNAGLDKVRTESGKIAMLKKKHDATIHHQALSEKLRTVELNAQITGVICENIEPL